MKTIVFILVLFALALGQRLELPYAYAYFNQPGLEQVEYWMVSWGDSVRVYKAEAERADSVLVRLRIDGTFDYGVEYVFTVTAGDGERRGLSTDCRKVFLVGDINKYLYEDEVVYGDDAVDGLDLIELCRYWSETGKTYRDFYDINGDGVVNILDIEDLRRDWGFVWVP